MNDALKKRIEDLIKAQDILLFMKGDKFMPMCGFSATVVDILNEYDIKYTSFDILEDEEIRQGLKEFSAWPTFPQLYVQGEFIGGCDIVQEMHENNELSEILKVK